MNPAVAAARRHGFTLLELAVVMAVTVVLLALAVPSMGPKLARQRLLSVGHQLAADLAQVRHEAAQRGQPLHVVFRPGADWCYAIALSDNADCRGTPTTDPQLLKAVHAVDNPGVTLLDALTITIEPTTGTPRQSLGQALFQDAQGEPLRVQLSPLGRAAVCSPNGALPQLARCAAPTL